MAVSTLAPNLRPVISLPLRLAERGTVWSVTVNRDSPTIYLTLLLLKVTVGIKIPFVTLHTYRCPLLFFFHCT